VTEREAREARVPDRGVVLWGTGGQWLVHTGDGQIVSAALAGRVKHTASTKLAVGDDVVLVRDEAGQLSLISELGPRRSELTRRNPGGARGERTVAVNVDQVIVVLALVKPDPREAMLDRFLVIAEANDLPALIVINKVDLGSTNEARERFGAHARAGYPLHFTSAVTGAGIDALHDALRGRTTVLAGPSGVGKSSLLNAMYPGLQLRVGEVSDAVNKGRHTTVGARMHPLPDGGYLVDTPGLREVGLWGLAAPGLDQCFPEFASALGNCRFSDCRHLAEPGCAVRRHVEEEAIDRRRYESYTKLYEEARLAERQLLER
jgi:ribosome biogenesis GTPase